MLTKARHTTSSAARVASIRSRKWPLPAWYGEPLMLTISSAPASACRVVGPVGYQMSSQMFTAKHRLAQREDGRLRAGLEVAVLVEDAVVRQVLLVVDAGERAVVEDGGGVEDVVALVDEADDRGDAARGAHDLVAAPGGWPR